MYTVIVGNIGTVYAGDDEADARRVYTEYCRHSASGVGRAGWEPVTWMEGEEILREYQPEVLQVVTLTIPFLSNDPVDISADRRETLAKELTAFVQDQLETWESKDGLHAGSIEWSVGRRVVE